MINKIVTFKAKSGKIIGIIGVFGIIGIVKLTVYK